MKVKVRKLVGSVDEAVYDMAAGAVVAWYLGIRVNSAKLDTESLHNSAVSYRDGDVPQISNLPEASSLMQHYPPCPPPHLLGQRVWVRRDIIDNTVIERHVEPDQKAKWRKEYRDNMIAAAGIAALLKINQGLNASYGDWFNNHRMFIVQMPDKSSIGKVDALRAFFNDPRVWSRVDRLAAELMKSKRLPGSKVRDLMR